MNVTIYLLHLIINYSYSYPRNVLGVVALFISVTGILKHQSNSEVEAGWLLRQGAT